MKRSLTLALLLSIALVCRPVDAGRRLRSRQLFTEADGNMDDYQLQMADKKAAKAKALESKMAAGGGGSTRKKRGGGGGDRAGMWKQNFALLEAYHKANGHANVPITYEEGEVKLGRWLRAVQKAWEGGKLPDEKQGSLKRLGLTPTPATSALRGDAGSVKAAKKEDRFADFAAALTAYKEEKGWVFCSYLRCCTRSVDWIRR